MLEIVSLQPQTLITAS